MFFGNSKNTLSASKNGGVVPINPTITNYVVGFVDESNPNYLLDTEGNQVGGCWEHDVESYLLETEEIPNNGGRNNYIVFDLLVSQMPIWPVNSGASVPPINPDHIVDIERPDANDPVDQNLFFNRVVQDLEARWTTEFWSIIAQNNKKFIIVIDDSGSMTVETIQGAINLLISYAIYKGIPSESILVLESCENERWLKWGSGALLNRESDLGCLGACETANILFCGWRCISPPDSYCYDQTFLFAVPRIVFSCNDVSMENRIKYDCPLCEINCVNSGSYFWFRDPSSNSSCGPPPHCYDGENSNMVAGQEVWAPGWINTRIPIRCLCGGSDIAGQETGVPPAPGQAIKDCDNCETFGGATSLACGCKNPVEAPAPCGTNGLTSAPFTFYKCVDCIYPNDSWDKITWPPPPGSFGGGEHELCRMASCSFTSGTNFGNGVYDLFNCDDCTEYPSCSNCVNEENDPFTTHETPGCNNSWLACKVGGFDSYCCESEWNTDCVNYAVGLVADPDSGFFTDNYGWTSNEKDYSFFGCTGYFVDYKDMNGKCLPCPAYHPITNHPLYAIEGCSLGCTNCAKETGFTAQDYSYLWVFPWNRCGIDCEQLT